MDSSRGEECKGQALLFTSAGISGWLCRANRLQRQALCNREVADVGNDKSLGQLRYSARRLLAARM